MCGNRVEELESRVKELEASVKGLTDELVECKVRIRELEGAVDEEFGLPDADPAGESDESDDSDTDIRVPEPGESPDEADTSKPEAAEGEDNTEESGSDTDIIVA